MSIISQETWDKFTEEEKEKILKRYKSDCYTMVDKHWFEEVIGIENLQPKPKIPKTWRDIEEYHTNVDLALANAQKNLAQYSHCPIQYIVKCIATLKIQKLIELGYGGMVTEEEWELSSSYENDTVIWSIICEYMFEEKEPHLPIVSNWAQPCLISFRTQQQAEEFMSHSENVELVKQYYMI